MTRHAAVVRLLPEAEAEYRRIHADVWPEVLDRIARCHISNYSIYLHDGLLIATFEYHGSDYEADMAAMAADPKTQEWWRVTVPMQQSLSPNPEASWWLPIEEVFHVD